MLSNPIVEIHFVDDLPFALSSEPLGHLAAESHEPDWLGRADKLYGSRFSIPLVQLSEKNGAITDVPSDELDSVDSHIGKAQNL